MSWEVEYTDQFGEWWDDLAEEEQDAVTAAVNVLQRGGPSLGRPLVDTIKQSRHKNMKELIPPASDLRVLFATRAANGAPGTAGWSRVADDLFDEHLRELESEGAPHAQDP